MNRMKSFSNDIDPFEQMNVVTKLSISGKFDDSFNRLSESAEKFVEILERNESSVRILVYACSISIIVASCAIFIKTLKSEKKY